MVISRDSGSGLGSTFSGTVTRARLTVAQEICSTMPQTFFTAGKPGESKGTEGDSTKNLKRVSSSQSLPGLTSKARVRGRYDVTLEEGCVARFTRRGSLPTSGKVRIAAFDMDDTLIATKSGLKFGRGPWDWKLLPNVSETLARRIAKEDKDYTTLIVIFTNQASVIPSLDAKSFRILEEKLVGVMRALPRVDTAFAAIRREHKRSTVKETPFRKPKTGMWKLLLEHLGDEIEVDLENSFFVGDAAGRSQDHSADDLGFANGAGLKFYLPEEFFKAQGTTLLDYPEAKLIDTAIADAATHPALAPALNENDKVPLETTAPDTALKSEPDSASTARAAAVDRSESETEEASLAL